MTFIRKIADVTGFDTGIFNDPARPAETTEPVTTSDPEPSNFVTDYLNSEDYGFLAPPANRDKYYDATDYSYKDVELVDPSRAMGPDGYIELVGQKKTVTNLKYGLGIALIFIVIIVSRWLH